MSYIFWSYGNSKIDLGFIDARHCPNCKRREIHEGIKHHRHFILVVPFYWSNRFYSYCIHCGQTTLLVGDERKYVKKLNKNAAKFFKTNEKLNAFLLDLMDMCRKYDVIDGDKINEQNLNKVIGLVKDKYSEIHKYKYEDRFYKDMTISCAESVLRTEKETNEKLNTNTNLLDSIENKLAKLKELFEKNLITEDEYNERKQELLESI